MLEGVGVHARGREGGERRLQGRHRLDDRGDLRRGARSDQIPARVLDDSAECRLGSEGFDFEGLDCVHQGFGASGSLGGSFHREVRLLPLSGFPSTLGDSRAVLSEAQELFGFGGVRGDTLQRARRIPRGKPCHGLTRVRNAFPDAGSVSADPGDDLGRPTCPLDRFGKSRHPIFEEIFCPLAQLDDAGVSSAEFVGGIGYLVVVELVQVEGLLHVGSHRVERGAQVADRVRSEFGFGERDLVDGESDVFVCRNERALRAASEVGILLRRLGLFTLASSPKAGHASILESRSRVRAEWSDAQGVYDA